MRQKISDQELEQWATTRADDAGHLARELVEHRRAAAERLKAMTTFALPTASDDVEQGTRPIEFRISVTGHDGCAITLSHWPQGYALERHGEIVWREALEHSPYQPSPGTETITGATARGESCDLPPSTMQAHIGNGSGEQVTQPIRLRLSRAAGFNLQTASNNANGLDAMHVGRPGPWGNPFVVGKHGDAAYCVDLYKALLAGMLRVGADPDFEALERTRRFVCENATELRGKNLACWCAPGKPCHADVLLSIANRQLTEAARD